MVSEAFERDRPRVHDSLSPCVSFRTLADAGGLDRAALTTGGDIAVFSAGTHAPEPLLAAHGMSVAACQIVPGWI